MSGSPAHPKELSADDARAVLAIVWSWIALSDQSGKSDPALLEKWLRDTGYSPLP